MIEFNKNSTGDYDLMLKNCLDQNEYVTQINYGDNTTKTDYIIQYNTTSRKGYDELHKYSLALLDSNRNIINKIEKKISYFNLGVNESKELCKGLSHLFMKSLDYISTNEIKEVKYFNTSFNVHKIDSSSYSIIAQGSGMRSLTDVENAFLKKAGQYLKSFEYYFESEKYSYKAPTGGFSSTYHKGYRVSGIIKRTTNNLGEPKKLNEKPPEFNLEFKK